MDVKKASITGAIALALLLASMHAWAAALPSCIAYGDTGSSLFDLLDEYITAPITSLISGVPMCP